MVTTIKITCDGVFIQSNPYLTAPLSTTPSPTTSTPTTPNDTSSNTATALPHSEKYKPEDNSIKFVDTQKERDCHRKNRLVSLSSTLLISPSRLQSSSSNPNETEVSSRKSPTHRRTPKTSTRHRYYFGSSNIYWCTQDCDDGLCKNENSLSGGGLTRSASSVIHKKLQSVGNSVAGSSLGSTKTRGKLADTSATPPPITSNRSQRSHKTSNLKEFSFFDKHNSSSSFKRFYLKRTNNNKAVSGDTSKILNSGFSLNCSAYSTKFATPEKQRIFSFLSSARKLYRNSARFGNTSDSYSNDKGTVKVFGSVGKDSGSVNFVKRRFIEDTRPATKRDKSRPTYVFGNSRNSDDDSGSANNTITNSSYNQITWNLSEEWFDEGTALDAKENLEPKVNLKVDDVDNKKRQETKGRKLQTIGSNNFLRKHINTTKQYSRTALTTETNTLTDSDTSSISAATKATKVQTTRTIRSKVVMNSHVSATQNGQTTVVGHHRGFSQPSVAVTANSAGDPWFLQSTGHQMPPTAPLRHNKRPAPQPTHNSGVGNVNNPATTSNSTLIVNSNTGVTNIGFHQHQSQQQLGHSQLHIVQSSNLLPHHHNTNSHHHHNAVHLSSHALNSHNLTNAGSSITSNHSPKSPNQQQQQQQQQHSGQTLATFVPSAGALQSKSGSMDTAGAGSSVHQQQPQQQQHLQLLSTVNSCNNNLMSSSLNATHNVLALHERGVPSKNTSMSGGGGSGSSGGNIGVSGSNNLLMHNSGLQQQQQHQQSQTSSLTSLQNSNNANASAGMSTSLHSFDINGGTNVNPNTQSWSNSSLSPTISVAPTHSTLQQQPQRKCEVKLNAMPWFHGSITRDEAEHLLQPREDGLFLVRESTNFPGDYTLCVCFQGKVEHYRVKYLENKLTIDDEEYFENLGQLVAHYEADADGLCTQLIKCLPKQGKQEFCINSRDFVDKGWVIPESDLQLRESIGKGEFGDVLLGILRNEKVAVKMLKDEGAVQKFLAEASVMTTLEHENLVKFIGLVFASKHIYLVTEYMSKGSLVDYLRSRGRQHITKKDQINFAFDTASGMEYLEAKKVVHRDLAARNVLISEDCIAKVSDFGLAREECYNLDVGKLPIKWTAPEALKNGRFSNKSDMWSFGILLWEIYSFGRVPYPRIPLADVVKHVEVGYKMEAPEGCPPEIYEMMRQAWDLNPTKRPTFAELKVKLLQLKNTTA